MSSTALSSNLLPVRAHSHNHVPAGVHLSFVACDTDRSRQQPRHLKPGGYVEFQEMHYEPLADDSSLTPNTPYAVRDFFTYLSRGMAATINVDSAGILQIPAELTAVGFERVTIKKLKCPIGVWPADPRLRECGAFLKQAILDGLPGLSRKPMSQLGWTRTQIEVFLLEVRRDLHNLRFHSYFPFYDVYARKPVR